MDPAKLAEVEALLEAAQQRPREQWASFLHEATDDEAVRQEVAKLLVGDAEAQSFFSGIVDRLADVASEVLDRRNAPQTFGAYRTVRALGHGGMGSVYEAERIDGQFEQRVAIKLIRRGMETDAAVSRFLAERQILAGLRHPGIAQLLDGGITEDGRPYFVLEFVPGEPLDVHCADGRLALGARLQLWLQIADAVEYAHRNLVVHRDLKPSNVMVNSAGKAKLLDFGIAKPLVEAERGLTRTGARAMTPEYAAPEQVEGGPITTATDVYGLGLLLYELITARRPYGDRTRSATELERVILREDPVRPSSVVLRPPRTTTPRSTAEGGAVRLSTTRRRLARQLAGDLDTICMTALRKEPERRYASVRALADDVRRHLDGQPIEARSDSLIYRAGKFVRRHRLGVASALTLAVTSGAFVASLVQESARTALQRDRAEAVSELLIDLLVEADPERHRGHELTAREVLDRGAARVESMHLQPDVQMTLSDVMGRAYRNLGAYDDSRRMLMLSLQLRRRLNGDDHPATADAQRELAELLRLRGEYDTALAEVEGALAVHRTTPNSEAYGEDLAVRGRIQHARGAYGRAEQDALDALRVLRVVHGQQHERVADVLNDLAATLAADGQPAEAERRYREALAIQRAQLGVDHPAVPATLNNLAGVLLRANDLPGAEEVQREALAIYHRIHGRDGQHPALATALSNLGVTRMVRGDEREAESLLSQALSMRRALLGADHTDVAQTGSTLGMLLQQAGRTAEAEPLLRDALRIREANLRGDHPAVVVSLNNVGLLLHDRSDLEGAQTVLLRALAVAEDRGGATAATTRNNLAAVLLDAGDLDGARTHYEQVLAWRRENLPAAHPHLALPLLGLGRIHCAQGRTREGEALLDEALAIRGAARPPEHWELAEVEAEIAGCLIASGRGAQAQELARRAHARLESQRGANDRRTQLAARHLGPG